MPPTDAERYQWLRDHWDAITGITWREPIGPKLDDYIDAAMAGVEAADRAFPCHPKDSSR